MSLAESDFINQHSNEEVHSAVPYELQQVVVVWGTLNTISGSLEERRFEIRYIS